MSRITELRERLTLILIADPDVAAGEALLDIVRAALRAGAPAVQLRAKALAARDTVELGRTLRREARAAGALFFVNDRVDIALVLGADGAHLGDDDLPLGAARAIVPPGFLLGRSVDTSEEARTAEREGADYLGLGPVFATTSKAELGAPIGPAGVAGVTSVVEIPVVGIGGIDAGNAAPVAAAGAAGVAAIRSVLAAPDPHGATRALLAAVAAGRRQVS